MTKKRRNKPAAIGIISDYDVCGGFMSNAKCYMHMNDAYFPPDQVMFPYEAKKIPEHRNPTPFRAGFLQSKSYSFPVTTVELEYMFDTLGFLCLHHDSPQYMIYLLDKLVSWLNRERKNPAKKCTIVTAL